MTQSQANQQPEDADTNTQPPEQGARTTICPKETCRFDNGAYALSVGKCVRCSTVIHQDIVDAQARRWRY